MDDIKNRRPFRGLFISPKTQVRFGLLFIAVAIILHAAMVSLGIALYWTWRNHPDVSLAIVSLGATFYLVVYFLIFLMGMNLSHRVLGPIINFEKCIRRLKAGDYSARVRLRKNDDEKMKHLAELVNELAETLEKKS
jgi:nitrate/nitrite-specific signal transduction histidine kinase